MLNQVQHDDRFSRNLMFCSFANKSNKTNTRTSFYSFAHFAHAHGMGIVGKRGQKIKAAQNGQPYCVFL